METTWVVKTEDAIEALGLIPTFIREDDPRSAVEQFNDRYAHGGGWFSFKGFRLIDEEGTDYALVYPGGDGEPDERYEPLGVTKLRDEIIIVFQNAWVVVLQKDGTWEAARMD